MVIDMRRPRARKTLRWLAIITIVAPAVAGCTAAPESVESQVGDSRTIEEARLDGCQAALLVIDFNLRALTDMRELLGRGFNSWLDVNEEVWAKGNLVAEYGETFAEMGVSQDSEFREAGLRVANAYGEFGFQGFFDAGAQWTDAVEHFKSSNDALVGELNTFVNLCPS